MQASDFQEFRTLITDVHSFYRQDVSTFSLDVWWQSMRAYDFPAVREALGRHTMNPDTGQFMPKPADVVKMLRGSTMDSALVAWAKADRAIRSVGPWLSVCFDDPLINAVISEMGGWIELTRVSDKELPFRAKEFENRYRGYCVRSQIPNYPAYLTGIAEQQNSFEGKAVEPPVLIGDATKAQAVLQKGSKAALLTVTPLKTLLLSMEGTHVQTAS